MPGADRPLWTVAANKLLTDLLARGNTRHDGRSVDNRKPAGQRPYSQTGHDWPIRLWRVFKSPLGHFVSHLMVAVARTEPMWPSRVDEVRNVGFRTNSLIVQNRAIPALRSGCKTAISGVGPLFRVGWQWSSRRKDRRHENEPAARRRDSSDHPCGGHRGTGDGRALAMTSPPMPHP